MTPTLPEALARVERMIATKDEYLAVLRDDVKQAEGEREEVAADRAALTRVLAEVQRLREALTQARREYGAFGHLSGETLVQIAALLETP